MRAAVALAAAALLALAGCGGSEVGIAQGGRVVGDAVTVYSSLPHPARGASRDMVDGQKLALLEAGGRAAGKGINFVSVDEGDRPRDAAANVEDIVRDPQVMAVIGSARSRTAMVSVPLLNAAGILHVSPGAGYSGFSDRISRGEPARWFPSGRRTFARLIRDDRVQARTLVEAARGAGAGVAVRREPGRVGAAMAAALREAGVEERPLPGADAVIYAGEDPEAAVAFAREELPRGAALVVPDALTRAGIAERLGPAVRRRTTLVTSAPEADPAFAAAFRERYGRAPGPYALTGYQAMRAVLGAIERAGAAAGRRSRVIDAFFVAPPELPRFRARPAVSGR